MTGNPFNYAKRGTTVNPKSLIVTYRSASEAGHSRTTPHGIGTPIPMFREKHIKFKEFPSEQDITSNPNEPSMEPESIAILDPVSPL